MKGKNKMNDFIIWNNKDKLIYRIEVLNKKMFKDIQKNENLKHKYFNFFEDNNKAINFLIPKFLHSTNLIDFILDMENLGYKKHVIAELTSLNYADAIPTQF